MQASQSLSHILNATFTHKSSIDNAILTKGHGFVPIKCYYGHGNLDFIEFSCVVKYYFPSFLLFQQIKNVQPIFSSEAIQEEAGAGLGWQAIAC